MTELINNSYKFRIYPTDAQSQLIRQTIGCRRFIWNYFLSQRKSLYQENGISTNYIAQQNQLPILKKELTWLKDVDSTALQASLRDLQQAYDNFFENPEHFSLPTFKKKSHGGSYRSINVTDTIRARRDKIKLPKLDWVKTSVHRYVKGKILSATVSLEKSGKYFVSIITREPEVSQLPKTNNFIGFDLGLYDYITLSNGEKIENPRWLRNVINKLKREDRRLSRKKLGSNNWEKQRVKVARLHEWIKNKRKDYQHKLSLKLVKNHDYIFREDLNVAGMTKNHKLSLSIHDASWSQFVTFLEYKAKRYGKEVIKINRFFPSSKQCHNCGYKNTELDLNLREWVCHACNIPHDRDLNAACNITLEGIKIATSTVGHTGIYACGHGSSDNTHVGVVKLPWLKQEKEIALDAMKPLPQNFSYAVI